MSEVKWPCHRKPQREWCDHSGAGDFMGHTCVTALRAKLFEWVQHRPTCASRREYYPPRGFSWPPCDCGLDNFLTENRRYLT